MEQNNPDLLGALLGTKQQPFPFSFSLGRGCNFFLFPNLLHSVFILPH